MDIQRQKQVLRDALEAAGKGSSGPQYVPIVIGALDDAGYVIARKGHVVEPKRYARDFLVAFTVVTDDQDTAQASLIRHLAEHLPGGVEFQLNDCGDTLDSWHVAEDDRLDLSDNSSAVFIPGDFEPVTGERRDTLTQKQARRLLEEVTDQLPALTFEQIMAVLHSTVVLAKPVEGGRS